MKTQFLCGTLLSCLALQMSCSNESENEPISFKSNDLSTVEISVDALYSNHHTISQKKAEDYALDAAKLLLDGDNNGLKSGVGRSVANTSVVLAPQNGLKSKGAQPDTLAYMVNFADGQGYAMVSADDRSVTRVLACIESGSYNADSINPIAAKMILEAQQNIVNDIDNFETYKDQAKKYCETNGTPTLKASMTQKAVTTSGPYLNNMWGQGKDIYHAYNQCCLHKCSNDGCNKTALVGCTNLSIGQVMSFYKKPERLDIGLYLHWNEMTAAPSIEKLSYYGRYDLQRLLAYIQDCNASFISHYGCSDQHGGTATGIKTYEPVFERIGYTCSLSTDYGCTTMFSLLNSTHAPLIINDNKHAWVIDGYKVITTLNITLTLNSRGQVIGSKSSVTAIDKYIHHNWGWYGGDNGYFALTSSLETHKPLDGKYDEGCYNVLSYTTTGPKQVFYLHPKN